MSFEEENTLKPTLGWFSATMLVAGSMIGSGIFVVSADIARTVGTSGLLIAVWVITGIITVLGAMSYGKLAAYLPKAGGQYVFLKEAWGELPAFLYGWCLLMLIQTGTLAAVAVAFAKYAGVLFPSISNIPLLQLGIFDLSPQKILAIAVLFFLAAYNSTGIHNGALLQNIFTALKIIALFLLIIIGLGFGHHLWDGTHNWQLQLPTNHAVTGNLITLIAFASVGALFSLDAWNYATFISAETKKPEKNIPVALLLGSSTVVLLYILANLGYLNLLTLPQIQLATEDRVGTAAMEVIFPGAGVTIMAIIILVSTFGCLNGLLLGAARVFYAMAKDGLLFESFAKLHPKNHSPNFSLWAQCVWAAVLTLSGTYGRLLDYTVFVALLFYVLTLLGLLKLGRQNPKALQVETFWQKSVPITYIIGASVIAFYLLFGDILAGDWQRLSPAGDWYNSKLMTSLTGLVFLGIGIPVYYYWKAKSKKVTL